MVPPILTGSTGQCDGSTQGGHPHKRQEKTAAVLDLLDEDRRMTVRHLAAGASTSKAVQLFTES